MTDIRERARVARVRTVKAGAIDIDGRRFAHISLAPLHGRVVELYRDTAIAGRFHIFDTAGAFVCVADLSER